VTPGVSKVLVECHAGYRGDETPRRFHLEERAIEIVDVLSCWTEPEARLFRVRGDDARVYTLRRDERSGRWSLPEVIG
jgi:hypothetical protein